MIFSISKFLGFSDKAILKEFTEEEIKILAVRKNKEQKGYRKIELVH